MVLDGRLNSCEIASRSASALVIASQAKNHRRFPNLRTIIGCCIATVASVVFPIPPGPTCKYFNEIFSRKLIWNTKDTNEGLSVV